MQGYVCLDAAPCERALSGADALWFGFGLGLGLGLGLGFGFGFGFGSGLGSGSGIDDASRLG